MLTLAGGALGVGVGFALLQGLTAAMPPEHIAQRGGLAPQPADSAVHAGRDHTGRAAGRLCACMVCLAYRSR